MRKNTKNKGLRLVMEEEEVVLSDATTIYIPSSLDDLSLRKATKIMEILSDKELKDAEIKLVSAVTGLNEKSVKKMKAFDFDLISKTITDLVLGVAENVKENVFPISDYTVIKIDNKTFAVEPELGNMETGAYIDLIEFLKEPAKNLHKIMAILYRPLKDTNGFLYKIESYVDEDAEDTKARQQLFLDKMPYSFVRSNVNFILLQQQN